jgi:DNA-binding transcriptional regulator LsrR (DeoR family)
VPFTREEIAQRLGTSRETVARYLHDLKRDRIIDINAHQIIVLNKTKLIDLVS